MACILSRRTHCRPNKTCHHRQTHEPSLLYTYRQDLYQHHKVTYDKRLYKAANQDFCHHLRHWLVVRKLHQIKPAVLIKPSIVNRNPLFFYRIPCFFTRTISLSPAEQNKLNSVAMFSRIMPLDIRLWNFFARSLMHPCDLDPHNPLLPS